MKKNITLILIISVLSFSNLTSAFANDSIDNTSTINSESNEISENEADINESDENLEGPTGGMLIPGEKYVTNEERIQMVENDDSLSDDEKQIMIDKLNGNFLTTKSSRSTRSSYSPMYLGVKYYKQETSYYCGPATVYQTLKYINGSSESQDDIADALGTTEDGTDGSNIPPYLNEQQSENDYIAYTITKESRLKNAINFDMKFGYPTILRVKLTKDSEFGYKSNGHYLNVGGQTAGGEEYDIVDPYYGYKNGPSSSSYYVSFDAVYTAVTSHFKSEIYY